MLFQTFTVTALSLFSTLLSAQRSASILVGNMHAYRPRRRILDARVNLSTVANFPTFPYSPVDPHDPQNCRHFSLPDLISTCDVISPLELMIFDPLRVCVEVYITFCLVTCLTVNPTLSLRTLNSSIAV